MKGDAYEKLTRRDKVNHDLFWLKDDALEESANLPAPGIIAADVAAYLETAMEQFATIAEDLRWRTRCVRWCSAGSGQTGGPSLRTGFDNIRPCLGHLMIPGVMGG